jgi:sporulation protein YqfC
MDRKKELIHKLAQISDLPDETMPGLALVEIAGNRRVLIEHHCGVIGYGRCQICVKVKNGTVSVSGSRLELQRMTKTQIIITGTIEDVRLTGGER